MQIVLMIFNLRIEFIKTTALYLMTYSIIINYLHFFSFQQIKAKPNNYNFFFYLIIVVRLHK